VFVFREKKNIIPLEDRSNEFLQNDDNDIAEYMTFHPRRHYVDVLISLWLFLFSYLQHNQKHFSCMG
jgi:hypothetical protein